MAGSVFSSIDNGKPLKPLKISDYHQSCTPGKSSWQQCVLVEKQGQQ